MNTSDLSPQEGRGSPICDPFGDRLQPQHIAKLQASALSREVIEARGYRSITKAAEKRELGVGAGGIKTPALVIPQFNWRGDHTGYVVRPDQPRMTKDGLAKYELLTGQKPVVDVNRLAQEQLHDPKIPLFITEGTLKADSAVSRGLCCVALPGVWGWKAANGKDGTETLPDWDEFPLKTKEWGRRVYIVFDSDVMVKRQVHSALVRLKRVLEGRGAEVALIYLPGGDGAAKCGLDDFLATRRDIPDREAIRDLLQYATAEVRALENEVAPRRVGELVPDAPNPDLVIPAPFFVKPEGTGLVQMGGLGAEFHTFARCPIIPVGLLVDVEDRRESLRVAFRRGDEWREVVMERAAAMDTRRIVQHADEGFPVASTTAKDVVEFLRETEGANLHHLPLARVSSRMGYQGERGSEGFLVGRDHLLPKEEGADAGADVAVANAITFRGASNGDEQIAEGFHSRGSFDEWLRIIQRIADYPRVILAFYASLTPAILKIVECPNFVVEWPHRTTTGKTTTLRVAASPWGRPDERAISGAMFSWDGTRVGHERLFALLSDLPVILDDTKRVKDTRQIAEVLYMVANGQGRGRGNLKGLATRRSFRTVLLSSGEAPCTSFTQDGGARTRVILVRGVPFGKDDADTRRLVEQVRRDLLGNYGHFGRSFVRWLLRNREHWGEVEQDYRQLVEHYANLAPNPEGGRLAEYVAAIAVTAKLAHRALQLPWDYKDPIDALWRDIAGEAADAAGETRALCHVIAWAYAHMESFYGRHRRDQFDKPIPPSCWSGRWDEEETWEFIALYRPVLDRVLREGGFEPEAILAGWKERRWLDIDSGGTRYDRQVRFEGEKPRMVVITRDAFDAAEA